MPEWLKDIDTSTILQYITPAIGALVLLFVGWIMAKWVGFLAARAMRKAKVEETLCRFVDKVLKSAVLIFVCLSCLSLFGIEVTAFAAVIAATGFAIGLAFQGSLSNLAAGVMLLIFRPFKVGDTVLVAGNKGKVFEIDIFVTTLDTPDNRRLIIPNGSIFGSTIENISHHKTRRVEVKVGTDYAADIDQTRKVLMDAANSIENVLPEPGPGVTLSALGASSVDWAVRVWADTGNFGSVKDALTRAIKISLDEAKIGIPYPQMDVHLSNPSVTSANM